MVNKLENYLLRIKEKRGGPWLKQLERFVTIFFQHPLIAFNNVYKEAMIGLTNQCQCKCKHCGVAFYQDQQSELTTQEVKEVIRQIKYLPSPVMKISFSGGEPLLRDDICQLVACTVKSGLFSDINTNGILLTQYNVKRLKKSGLHHIYVSLDSIDQDTHDNSRERQGCYSAALQGIINCIKEKLSCSISAYVSRSKLYSGEIKDIIEMGRRLNVISVRLVCPVLSGKMFNVQEEVLSPEDMKMLKRLLQPDFVYLEAVYNYHVGSRKFCAAARKHLFYISSSGDMQPCFFLPLKYGNVKTTPLQKILANMWSHSLFKQFNCTECLTNELRLNGVMTLLQKEHDVGIT